MAPQRIAFILIVSVCIHPLRCNCNSRKTFFHSYQFAKWQIKMRFDLRSIHTKHEPNWMNLNWTISSNARDDATFMTRWRLTELAPCHKNGRFIYFECKSTVAHVTFSLSSPWSSWWQYSKFNVQTSTKGILAFYALTISQFYSCQPFEY